MRVGFYACKVIICLLLCVINLCFAQNSTKTSDELRRQSLVGLTEVKIVVNDLGTEFELAGVKANQIQKEVEIQVRKAGITVSAAAKTTLIVNVNSLQTEEGLIVFYILIPLNQDIILKRDSTILTRGSTWATGGMGFLDKFSAYGIRDEVRKYINEFLEDYLKANNKFSSDVFKELSKDNEKNKSNQNQSDSPFTATYVGGNRPPELEVFNDSDRTLYFDFGQDEISAYTIPPKTSKKIKLTEGVYKYKATAPRVAPLEGQDRFQTGYVYSWRFTIVRYSIPR